MNNFLKNLQANMAKDDGDDRLAASQQEEAQNKFLRQLMSSKSLLQHDAKEAMVANENNSAGN